MSFQYENIIFEGGGIKGAAYARIPEILEEFGILKNIKKIAGSSAGSIAALMLALEYSPKMIKEIIQNMDFNKFVDNTYYSVTGFKICTKLGINSGDYLTEWIKSLIMTKTGNKNTTFIELHKLNKLELVITGTSMLTRKTEYFSYKTTPNMPIWQAVRISITIPIFFVPIKYNDAFYLDGGILSNFPIWIFDGNKYDIDLMDLENKNHKTLGFKLISRVDESDGEKLHNKLKSFSLFPLIWLCIQLILLLIKYIDDSYTVYDYWDRTVGIDVMDVKSTDFDTDKDKLIKLQNNGYNQTKIFLNNKLKCMRIKRQISSPCIFNKI